MRKNMMFFLGAAAGVGLTLLVTLPSGPLSIARAAAGARHAAREVVAKLVASGVIDDAAFATARARRLNRAGRSRRAVTAHLLARGVDRDLAGEALPDDPEAELAAALAFARRRRVGPFRTGEADADLRRREAGMLARAGFGQEIATRALRMDPDEAEAAVLRLRQS